MGWFGGAFESALFFACMLMLVYNAITLARTRKFAFLHVGQMAFYLAIMLTIIPNGPAGSSSHWTLWVAFALLLVSGVLTLAHKRRSKPPPTDAGAESGRS